MKEFTKFGEQKYLALIGDVASSRELENRDRFQARLLDELRRLNRRFAEGASPAVLGRLTLLKGDEIQCLLAHSAPVFAIVRHLRDELYPHRVVWGLGLGALSTTGEDPRDPLQMDGPAFHRARGALGEAKRGGLWLRTHGLGKERDRVVSAMFEMLDALRSRWTKRQHEIVRELRGDILEGMEARSQKDVAGSLEISPSVVSESLRAAAFRTVKNAEEAIPELLDMFTSEAQSSPDSPAEPK